MRNPCLLVPDRIGGLPAVNTPADLGGNSGEGLVVRTVGDQNSVGSGYFNLSHRGDFGYIFHLGIPQLMSDGNDQTGGGNRACIGIGVYGGNGIIIDNYGTGFGLNITQKDDSSGYGILVTQAAVTTDTPAAKPSVRLASLVAAAPTMLEIVTGVDSGSGAVNPSAGTRQQDWKSTFGGVGGIRMGSVYADTGAFQWDKDAFLTRMAVAAPKTGGIAAVSPAFGTVEVLRVGSPGTVSNEAAVMIAADATTTVPLVLQAKASQSASLFRIQDSTGASLIAVSSNGTMNFNVSPSITNGVNIVLGTGTGTKIGTSASQKLGFYNATPVAQQTGVAVTAAGIHAALVNLGLITA